MCAQAFISQRCKLSPKWKHWQWVRQDAFKSRWLGSHPTLTTAPLHTPRLCEPYSGFDFDQSYISHKFSIAAHSANAAFAAAAGGPARQQESGRRRKIFACSASLYLHDYRPYWLRSLGVRHLGLAAKQASVLGMICTTFIITSASTTPSCQGRGEEGGEGGHVVHIPRQPPCQHGHSRPSLHLLIPLSMNRLG